MLWVTLAILAYFLSAIVGIIDKILLADFIAKPKLYAFYIGAVSIFALGLIPFGFVLPSWHLMFLAFLSGGIWVFAVLAFFEALNKYEASRVISAIGAMLPLFTLGFSYLFLVILGKPIKPLGPARIIAFILLVLGGFLISWDDKKGFNFASLKFSFLSAVLFALSYVTSKIVYLEQPFISGLIWLRIGSFLASLLFIFPKSIRKDIFLTTSEIIHQFKRKLRKEHKETAKVGVVSLFLFNQLIGGGAGFLQNLSMYLAPMSYLAFIYALEGIKYVFLLIFTLIMSWKIPKILYEKLSRPIISQKVIAILIIAAGLAIFALY